MELTDEEKQMNLATQMIQSLLKSGFDFSEIRWFAMTGEKYFLEIAEQTVLFEEWEDEYGRDVTH